jgi:hypothetical protein
MSLAACQPFHAGAAATVGDHRISTSQLRGIIDRETSEAAAYAATSTGAQSNKFSSVTAEQQALTELIQIQVLSTVLADEGITVTQNEIDKEREAIVTSATSQTGGTEEQVRQLAAGQNADLETYAEAQAYRGAATTAATPTDDEVTAFASTAGHEVVEVERLDVGNETTAEEFLAQVRQQPGSFDSVVQQAGASTTPAAYTGQEFAALFPGQQATQGSVLGPVEVSAGDYAVFSIAVVSTDTVAQALATSSLDREALLEERFDAAYTAAEKKLGVHVSPRFGAWTISGFDELGSVGALPASKQLSLQVSKPTASPTTGTSGQ